MISPTLLFRLNARKLESTRTPSAIPERTKPVCRLRLTSSGAVSCGSSTTASSLSRSCSKLNPSWRSVAIERRPVPNIHSLPLSTVSISEKRSFKTRASTGHNDSSIRSADVPISEYCWPSSVICRWNSSRNTGRFKPEAACARQ